MSRQVEFSVIMPVCHGGIFLEKALDSLAQLEFPGDGFEVVVAGNEKDQDLRKVIESRSPKVNYLLNYVGVSGSNRSLLLNNAIFHAQGDVLVFTDDDCTFPRDWLAKLAQVFVREPDIGVVGGRDRTEMDEPSLNVALDYVLNSFLGTGGLRRNNSLVGKYYPKLWNMAIQREVALEVAFRSVTGESEVFDESLDVHEDVELVDRVEKSGKRIAYAPEVHVMHSRDTTLQSFANRSFNMARTSRSVGVHRLPHTVLAVFTLGLVALAFASCLSRPAAVAFAAVCTTYFIILAASGLGSYVKTRRLSVFFYVPLLLAVQHFARGLGYLFPWRAEFSR